MRSLCTLGVLCAPVVGCALGVSARLLVAARVAGWPLTGVVRARQLVPDTSPADPSHGTAEPISQFSGISREMYLRKGTKC